MTITPKGSKLFEAARVRHHRDVHDHLLSILSDGEIRRLASITAKILAAEQNREPQRPRRGGTAE